MAHLHDREYQASGAGPITHFKALASGYRWLSARRVCCTLDKSYDDAEEQAHKNANNIHCHGLLQGLTKEMDYDGSSIYTYQYYDSTLFDYVELRVEQHGEDRAQLVFYVMGKLLRIFYELHVEKEKPHGCLREYPQNIVAGRSTNPRGIYSFHLRIAGLRDVSESQLTETKRKDCYDLADIFEELTTQETRDDPAFQSLMRCLRDHGCVSPDNSFYFVSDELKYRYLNEAWRLVRNDPTKMVRFNREMGESDWFVMVNRDCEGDIAKKRRLRVLQSVFELKFKDRINSEGVTRVSAAGFLKFCRDVDSHHFDQAYERRVIKPIKPEDLYGELYEIWPEFFNTIHEKLTGAGVCMGVF